MKKKLQKIYVFWHNFKNNTYTFMEKKVYFPFVKKIEVKVWKGNEPKGEGGLPPDGGFWDAFKVFRGLTAFF